jgi:UDP-N-acetylglucosamine transferase subunit ALG13
MDEIAGRIDEAVIMQIGETTYKPKNARYFRFTSNEEIDRLYEDTRVVVCHAGVGSILTTLEHGKPVIAVPRRSMSMIINLILQERWRRRDG